MSFNGSGTFVINSTGQPVVTGTVISASTFNSLTADLGTGLSTTVTKDGQTTTTAKIPFALGLSAAAASNFAAGTVGLPAIYLSTDTTTGLYRIGANNDGFAVSGAKVLDIASTGLGITGTLGVSGATTLSSTLSAGATLVTTLGATGVASFAAGAVGAPGIYFGSDTTTGLYRIGANNDGYAVSGAKVLDIASTGLAITGTLSATGLISPAQTVGIVGTTTNNSVQAGSVGEYVSSTVALTTSGYTSGTTPNVTSISLTAGDWDVSGLAAFANSGTLTTNIIVKASISTTSATNGASDANMTALSLPSPGDPPTTPAVPTPVVRLLLASTTTVYLVAQTNFTSGGATMGVGGTIRARRMR